MIRGKKKKRKTRGEETEKFIRNENISSVAHLKYGCTNSALTVMLVIRFSDSGARAGKICRGGDARRRSSSRFRKLALYLYLISCVELERLNNGRWYKRRWATTMGASLFVRNVRQTIIIYSDVFHCARSFYSLAGI